MNLKEADEIIQEYEYLEDKDCSCHQGAPCSKCERIPPEDMYKEAQTLIEKGKENAIRNLDELLEHELGDYTFKWEIRKDSIEFFDGSYLIDVNYYMYDYENQNSLTFKVRKDFLSVCKYEDVFEEIHIYEPSIKHLWMVIKWD